MLHAVRLLGQQARKEQQDGLGLSLPRRLGEEAGSHKGHQQWRNGVQKVEYIILRWTSLCPEFSELSHPTAWCGFC